MARADQLTEEQFQQQVTDLCDQLRLKWHHETDSRRTTEGWLDLVICGPGGVIFAELKREKGSRTSKAQLAWIKALEEAGAEVYLWRPSDLEAIRVRLHHLAGRRQSQPSYGWRRYLERLARTHGVSTDVPDAP
jgi:hypothetical protein